MKTNKFRNGLIGLLIGGSLIAGCKNSANTDYDLPKLDGTTMEFKCKDVTIRGVVGNHALNIWYWDFDGDRKTVEAVSFFNSVKVSSRLNHIDGFQLPINAGRVELKVKPMTQEEETYFDKVYQKNEELEKRFNH